jgi:hypothetical protein
MRAIYLQSIPAVKRLLDAGANPTVRLSWRISDKLKGNPELHKIIEKARVTWQKNKDKDSHTAPKRANVPIGVKKPRGPKPTIGRLLKLMKHDYLTDEDEALPEIEELIAELGDLSEIEDGTWPSIDKFESPRLLRCLLAAGLNPEITDKKGGSLLSQCVMHPESIDLLVQRGVDIDRRSGRDNATALMRATYMGDEECVQRLLKAGANPTLEFSPFAKVLLDMDEEMTALIEAARVAWNRKSHCKKAVTKAVKKSTVKKRKS